jgi:hypothetical protein
MRRVRRVLLAPLLAAVLAACAAAEPPAPPPRPDPLADVRTRPPADPVDVCTNGVVHWAEVDLAGGEYYGDYQQRAMSVRQDQLRAEIVDAGRAAGGFTPEQVRGRARAGCEALLAADPGPSGY